MDKKSEEELERIANLLTAEMVRSVNTPKSEDNEEEDNEDSDDESARDDERDPQPPGKARA